MVGLQDKVDTGSEANLNNCDTHRRMFDNLLHLTTININSKGYHGAKFINYGVLAIFKDGPAIKTEFFVCSHSNSLFGFLLNKTLGLFMLHCEYTGAEMRMKCGQ